MDDKLYEEIRLQPFNGNHFNILFNYTPAAYYYRDLVKEFVGEVHGTPKQLQCSVLEDDQLMGVCDWL